MTFAIISSIKQNRCDITPSFNARNCLSMYDYVTGNTPVSQLRIFFLTALSENADFLCLSVLHLYQYKYFWSSNFTSYLILTYTETIQSWVFHPVQQPRSYWDSSSTLLLAGVKSTRR